VVAFACALVLAGLRPLSAWWQDAAGNRALLRGDDAGALGHFDRALRFEPQWALLHEDRGRALAERDPAHALLEFDRADCGAPCSAEAGDALVRLGRPRDAVSRYIDAKAVSKVSDMALSLARQGRYDDAAALVNALIGRLHDDFLERADLASSYAALGAIEIAAAAAQTPRSGELRAYAIAAYAAASRLAPFNEGYLLSYAFAQAQWGDPAAARRAFQRVLEIHPHQVDAEAALAHMGARGPTPQPTP
jgi:tetratricopeptide (TPR) repeat protein